MTEREMRHAFPSRPVPSRTRSPLATRHPPSGMHRPGAGWFLAALYRAPGVTMVPPGRDHDFIDSFLPVRVKNGRILWKSGVWRGF